VVKQTKNALQGMLNNRSPQNMRQAVQPIDILSAAAEPNVVSEQQDPAYLSAEIAPVSLGETKLPSSLQQEKQVETTLKKTERKDSTQKVAPIQRPKKPHVFSERAIHAVLAPTKRKTVRYSFEIFEDQRKEIQQVCELYESQHTNEKLSASRLLRELLDSFLPDALKALDKTDEKNRSEK
jgi:hypothetical protein